MQHLSVNFERSCVTVLNMYHVTKNTGLVEIIVYSTYQAYFVSLVACTVERLSGRRKAYMYTDVTDHFIYY